MKQRSPSPNVTKNLALAGFQMITIGRFWVIAEANSCHTEMRAF